MPPPFPTSRSSGQTRMTANPLKPVGRYRPGKAVVEEQSDSEDEEEDDEEEKEQQQQSQVRPKASSFPAGRASGSSKPRVPDVVDSDEEGFVTEEDEDEDAAPTAKASLKAATSTLEIPHQLTVSPTIMPKKVASEQDGDESEDEDSSADEESESSSEDEVPQRKLLRPTFIKKSDRNGNKVTAQVSSNLAASPQPDSTVGTATMTADTEGLTEEEVRRREVADLMIKDKLERDARARAAGKKSWDDDEEVAPEDMVDDTDGLDPEAELAAWKLRELKRLKRDREAIVNHEKEIEEVERRRNLTAEEREKEDREYLAAQKEERESGRGKAGFLQRYHHKGAFFQDDEVAKEVLARRDLMGARFVDEVQNREALPEYMQVRDMTKLGRKGRTRYKDLRAEDTGRWGDFGRPGLKKEYFAQFGDDDRFRPDDDRRNAQGPTGANAGALGQRRDQRVPNAPDGPRAMKAQKDRDAGDSYRPARISSENGDDQRRKDRHRDRSYSKSRSASPTRERQRYGRQDDYEDSRSWRKRSPSPYQDKDKRRRVGAT